MYSDFAGMFSMRRGTKATVNVVAPFDRDGEQLYSFQGTVNAISDIGVRVYDDDTTLIVPWTNIQSIYWSENNA